MFFPGSARLLLVGDVLLGKQIGALGCVSLTGLAVSLVAMLSAE